MTEGEAIQTLLSRDAVSGVTIDLDEGWYLITPIPTTVVSGPEGHYDSVQGRRSPILDGDMFKHFWGASLLEGLVQALAATDTHE